MTELNGEIIKNIYQRAEDVARLHNAATSRSCKFFRMELLNKRSWLSSEIKKLRDERKVKDSKRHLSRLTTENLIIKNRLGKNTRYIRTEAGDEIVAIIKNLQRKIGERHAKKIFKANLGPDSIKFFLNLYGSTKKIIYHNNDKNPYIKFRFREIKRLASFLPRTVDEVAVLDRLDEARLLFCKNRHVVMSPIRSKAFYQYLKNIYILITS